MGLFDAMGGAPGGQPNVSAFSSSGMAPSALAMLLAMQNRAMPQQGMAPSAGPPMMPNAAPPAAGGASPPNLGPGGPAMAPNMLPQILQMLGGGGGGGLAALLQGILGNGGGSIGGMTPPGPTMQSGPATFGGGGA